MPTIPIMRATGILCLVAVHLLTAASAAAQRINLPRPGDREFILDRANLLLPADREAIRQRCEALLAERATPIVVVTIDSMAAHGGAGLRVETFATLLFDQWQVGQATLHGQPWNVGVLLLVSRNDRKARIELGAGWGHEYDAQARQIMEDQIIPRFKEGDYSRGIAAGVEGLDAMARDLPLPSRYRPPWHYFVGAGVIGLAIFSVVSLARRGSGGWAWVFWGILFTIVGSILYAMLTSGSRRRGFGGGGGFSGGSFGGGFSGGGGASGSW